ncbi:MAG: hypothetical protein ACD_30C00058G0001 [uncultured bacterium]|nr:MAG: hypothetical protein ACD_30C00058G0001 [uncultured bacterium]
MASLFTLTVVVFVKSKLIVLLESLPLFFISTSVGEGQQPISADERFIVFSTPKTTSAFPVFIFVSPPVLSEAWFSPVLVSAETSLFTSA